MSGMNHLKLIIQDLTLNTTFSSQTSWLCPRTQLTKASANSQGQHTVTLRLRGTEVLLCPLIQLCEPFDETLQVLGGIGGREGAHQLRGDQLGKELARSVHQEHGSSIQEEAYWTRY